MWLLIFHIKIEITVLICMTIKSQAGMQEEESWQELPNT